MRKILPLVILAFLIFTSMCMASENSDYTIMPGDVLDISILGFPEYTETVSVMPNGIISLHFGIDLKVKGLTSAMVREMITIEYSQYLRNPNVTVRIAKFHNIYITVVGHVRSPGRYSFEPIPSTPAVSDAIGVAGGLLPTADTKMVTFIRETGEDAGIRYIDLDVLYAGDLSANYELVDGDVLFIPEKVQEVLVLGQVQKPGAYSFTANTTVLDLIAEAGGLTDKADAKIVHTRNVDGEAVVTEVDLEVIMQNKLDPSNKKVQAGDIIVVPETRKITTTGVASIISIIKGLLEIFNIIR